MIFFPPHNTSYVTWQGYRWTLAPEWPQTATPSWLCPDLLRYEQIGAAGNIRGRVVRAFFWLMRVWPV